MLIKQNIPNIANVARYIVNHCITQFDSTPSYLELLIDATTELPLRRAVAGGESLNSNLNFNKLSFPVFNSYGPTEATITSTNGVVSAKVTIGKPLSNVICYVLSIEDKQLCGLGLSGELYIGGDGLARGYLNQPELTVEKFIDNPFATEEDKKLGRNFKFYKTGDLVRWLPDGNLEFIGRIDDQVKIRGFNRELGEIEAVLSKYSNVSQRLVLAKGEGQDKNLVAYVKSQKNKEFDQTSLRSYLKEQLPDLHDPKLFYSN